MKLLKINIDNYKSLRNVNIENLSDINLVYGYNNSGKSNILNFLEILFREKTIEGEDEYEENGETQTRRRVISKTPFYDGFIYNSPYVFFNNDKSTPISYDVQIKATREELNQIQELISNDIILEKDDYEVSIKGEIHSFGIDDLKFVLNSANLDEIELAKQDGRSSTFLPSINNDNIDKDEIASNLLSSFNNSVLFLDSDRYFHPEFSNTDLGIISSKNFKAWLFEQFMNHKKKDDFDGIVQFLKSFKFDLAHDRYGDNLKENSKSSPFNNSTEVGFTRFDNELELMLKNDFARFPLKNFGTGIQQILYILSRVYHTKANIVIVEELELNLSPLFQFELVRFLKSRIGNELNQLIFTSHSPNFNHEPELVDHHCYRIKINNEGVTNVIERRITVDTISPNNLYE